MALGCCRKRLAWPVTVKTLNGLLGHTPLGLECARDMKNSLYARSNNLHISYIPVYIYTITLSMIVYVRLLIQLQILGDHPSKVVFLALAGFRIS